MCKKSLLMMLLMALFAPWAAKAQTLTVCDGTVTNSYIPIYGYWADAAQHNQMIYPASELTDMVGMSIDAMKFYLNSGATGNNIGSWTIKLGETTATTLSGLDETTTLTQVYSGAMTFDATNMTMSMVFDNGYVYNGGNLLVDFTHSAASYRSMSFLGIEATSASVNQYSTNSPTVRDFLPKNTFTYSVPATCSKPTGLAAALTEGDGTVATLSWTENGTASTWQICLNGDETNLIAATTNPWQLTGLTPETAYTAKVRAYCSADDQSEWSNEVTFKPSNAISFTVNDGTNTNGYVPIYGFYVDAITKSQFIIPARELADMAWGTITKMTFYAAADKDWGAAQFEVYMTETAETTLSALADYSTMTKVMNSASLGISGNQMVVEFDTPYQYSGGNLMIGFLQTVSGSYSSCSWYGVTAEGASMGGYGSSISQQNFLPKTTFAYLPGEAPSCMWPTNLAVSNIAARTAELSWTENGEATAWDIDVNGTVTAVSENPYTLVGLEPETEYTVKVRANCGGGDYSEWTAAVTFTTDVTCHTPTALTVSDITAFTANVNWTGTETTHQLRYVANPPMFFQGYVTDPGAMADGSDASWLHGSSTWGPGVQYSVGNMLADDFTVGTATALTEIEVYAYQTGSTTESTFTGLYAVICDGNPADSTTNIVWGDTQTNIMTSTAFTNCYRGSDGETTAMTRPIMAITASGLNIELEPGTYWLVYSLAGTGSSGPWGVPYADPVIGNTGNGWQYTSNGWAALNDSGTGAYGLAMKLMFGDMEAFDWTYVNNIEANTYGLINLEPETDYLLQVRATCGGDDGNSEWATATFTTLPTCLTPTALTVSDIEARQAVLTWTENGDATAWDIDVNGTVTAISQNPYTLTGLQPSTRYTVKVRANCGGGDYSEWSNEVTFTTDVSCHAPTNLTYTDITRSSATIGWTSDNDNFELWYREHAVGGTLTTNFDDSNMNGWTTIDADNDGYDWVLGSETGSIYLVEGGSLAGTGHNDSEDMMCSGSYSNYTGAALTPDNYLVSPQVALGGSITFYACAQDATYAAEHFGVAVSTTGNTNAADFTTIQEWTLTAKSRGASDAADIAYNNRTRGGNRDQSAWYEYTVDLSAYSGTGYVAIRHFNCTDQFILNVDDIVIEQPAAGGPDEWIEVNNATNPYTITGLNPETTYDVKVRSNCGDYDGYSTWLTGSFTTPEGCPAPSALAATPYANSAVLSWEGISESYTVRYGIIEVGEILSSFDFEDETIPADFTNSTTYAWTVAEGGADDSGYCVIPGNAGVNSSTSDLTLQVTGPCSVSFMAKVSSENNWDWGRFLIDGTQQMQISGTKDWESYSYTVAAGTHTLVWRYYKDGSGASGDDLFYVDNIVINEMSYAWETTTATTNECTITGLTSLTTYYVQVMGDCGDYGTSAWSEIISFTTTDDLCPVPTNLAVDYINGTSADLSWNGSPDVESFTVRYKTVDHAAPGGLYEPFGVSLPTGWAMYTGLLDTVMVRPSALTSATSGWNFGSNNGVFDDHARVNIWSNYQRWLVTPEVTVAEGGNFTFDLALTKYSGTLQPVVDTLQQDDKFIVLISTDSLQTWTILREWNNSSSSYVYNTIATEGEAVSIDLSAYVGQTVHIAFYGESTNPSGMANTGGDNNLHIDNVLIGTLIPATEWQTVTTSNMNVTLTGLTLDTPYEAQVKADCSDPEAWSNTESFTTLDHQVQTIALSAGWNWISANVEITMNNLKDAIVAAYPNAGMGDLSIKALVGGQSNYNPNIQRWIGGPSTIDLSQMYRVKVPAAGAIVLEGMPMDPTAHPVTIKPGANWIGFPFSENMSIATAFAGFPTRLDNIKSASGQTNFNGAVWIGGLKDLEPGKGYIYNSKATTTKTFTYPTNTSKK